LQQLQMHLIVFHQAWAALHDHGQKALALRSLKANGKLLTQLQ